jgi:hypothetical protein
MGDTMISEYGLQPAPLGTRRLCVMREGRAVVRERILATERVASWLQAFHVLVAVTEQHDRTLIDADGL